MSLVDVFKTGALNIPWPMLADGRYVVSTTGRNAPFYCLNDCKDKVCERGDGTLLGSQCPVGFTYFQGKVDKFVIIVFGTIGQKGRESINVKVRIKYKEDLKGRGVTAREFLVWLDSLKELAKFLSNIRDKTLSEALHPLHETPKIAEEIRNQAEAIINLNPGKSFDDRFSAAGPAEKGVYKGAQFLVDSFEMLSIFFNPDSAKIGEKRLIEPYKLVHKITMLLSNNNSGVQRRRISIEGATFRKYLVLESFRIVPLTLLNNSIKYSMTEEVVISVVDKTVGTEFSVITTGPYIEDNEIDIIFQRGTRGKYAEILDRDGMGIGLYVAQKAAFANRTKISVNSQPLGYELKSIPMARNTFSFIVRDVS